MPTELHPQKQAVRANVHVGLSVGRLAYRQLANKPRQAGWALLISGMKVNSAANVTLV